MSLKIFLPFFAAVMFLLASCSGSAPVIEDLRWRVIYRENGQNRYEELFVSVLVSDADGAGDLAAVNVLSDGSNLVWNTGPSDWIRSVERTPDWIDLPGMVMHDSSPFPDTLFTVRVEDLAGRRDERGFRPDPLNLSIAEITWPKVSIRDGILVLEKPYSSGTLYLRDEKNDVIDYFSVENGAKIPSRAAVTWEIWIPIDGRSTGFLLGPFTLREDR